MLPFQMCPAKCRKINVFLLLAILCVSEGRQVSSRLAPEHLKAVREDPVFLEQSKLLAEQINDLATAPKVLEWSRFAAESFEKVTENRNLQEQAKLASEQVSGIMDDARIRDISKLYVLQQEALMTDPKVNAQDLQERAEAFSEQLTETMGSPGLEDHLKLLGKHITSIMKHPEMQYRAQSASEKLKAITEDEDFAERVERASEQLKVVTERVEAIRANLVAQKMDGAPTSGSFSLAEVHRSSSGVSFVPALGRRGALTGKSTGADRTSARPFSRRVVHKPVMQAQDDLETFAKQLNPVVGYWDPLNLARGDFWDQGNEATIGFLRHAEIKHGRVAMAAFVGFVLQSNGIHFPGNLANGVSYESIAAAGGPADQWDAVPLAGRAQIILFVGFLEFLSENNYILGTSGMTHYMRGGKPGAYPSIKKNAAPHPIPFDLYDPFGLAKRMSAEKKERRLIAEVNNGRLAMFGIMGFVAEAKIPGSVPALANLGIEPYYGEVMTPFTLEEGIFASGIPLV